jgi:hypothetical protein
MITTLETVVAGQTARSIWQLKETTVDSSTPANLDGSGFTVADVLLTSVDGEPVDTAGKIGWSSQGDGQVYFDPAAGDFAFEKSPYRVRVKLTDGNGKIRFYPQQGTAEIRVLSARA